MVTAEQILLSHSLEVMVPRLAWVDTSTPVSCQLLVAPVHNCHLLIVLIGVCIVVAFETELCWVPQTNFHPAILLPLPVPTPSICWVVTLYYARNFARIILFHPSSISNEELEAQRTFLYVSRSTSIIRTTNILHLSLADSTAHSVSIKQHGDSKMQHLLA